MAEGGRIAVRDVPIFAENDRGGQKYDEAWLRGAVLRDQARRMTGYKAPMHLGHHEVALERKRAGDYALESVRYCLYDGKPLWVIFGSLYFANEAVLSQTLRDYPYRSVEIAAGDAPGEINSLALLSTEAPYFRFPNLENLTFAALPNGGSAFAWRTKMALVSDNFDSASRLGDLPTHPSMTPPVKTTPMAPVNANEAPDADSFDDAAGDFDASDAVFGADADSFDADGYDADAPDADVFQKATITHLRFLNKKFAAFASASVNPSGGAKTASGKTGSSGANGADGAPGDQSPIVSAAAKTSAAFAQISGRLAATEAALAKAEADRKFASLYSELKPYGIKNLAKLLRESIAAGQADAFAAGIRLVKPVGQTTDAETAEGASLPANDPPEVSIYQGAQRAEARRLYAMFKDPKNPFKTQSVAAFLAANVTVEA
jgi:hypothetical protein